jgi:hypothetical protein
MIGNKLSLLKMDLGISHSHRDEYFISLLDSAAAEIMRRGITLTTSIEDELLIVDYASWSYRKRQEDIPLSKNIQLRIRNRIIQERANR